MNLGEQQYQLLLLARNRLQLTIEQLFLAAMYFQQVEQGNRLLYLPAYYYLVQGRVNFVLYRLFLQNALVLDAETRDNIINDIRVMIGTDAFNPDSSVSIETLIYIFTTLVNHHVQPVHMSRIVTLALSGGALSAIPSYVEAVRQRLIAEIDAVFNDAERKTFYEGLTLAQLWNGQGQKINATDEFDIPTYSYNRQNVATLGIERIRGYFSHPLTADTTPPTNVPNGNFPFGAGNLRGDLVNRLSGDFIYGGGILTHQVETTPSGQRVRKTGSSIFMSEIIHHPDGGNIPLITRISGGDDCASEPANGESVQAIGWRVCCDSGNSTTGTWRDHSKLASFFHNPLSAQASNMEYIGIITYDELLMHMSFDNGALFRANSELAFKELVYGYFRPTGALHTLDTGDYIYIGSTASHGFMIVGWGEAVEGADGLNAIKDTETDTPNLTHQKFSLQRNPNRDEIPYVVDFGYGYNDFLIATGWLQDVRPRPFYYSNATISRTVLDKGTDALNLEYYNQQDIDTYTARMRGTYGPYGRDTWHFFKFSDFHIIPSNEVYVCSDPLNQV